MIHTVVKRNIPAAYDELVRLVWWQGRNRIDQRHDKVRELKHVWTEITTPDIRYPDFGPTSKEFGERFAEGLHDWEKGDFDYTYGERVNANANVSRSIKMLKENPETRRVVLNIYSAMDLLSAQVNVEVPCATQSYVNIEDEKVEMTLMMRSNDIVGAYPSDVYGFRRLQEYIANELGREIGTFRHYAESAHIILANDAEWVKKHIQTPKRWY